MIMYLLSLERRIYPVLTWLVISISASFGANLETSAKAIVERQETAWNSGDAEAWGADYTEDSTFVNIMGMRFSSRSENVARHALLFDTIFSDSTLEIKIVGLRPAGEAAAIMDTIMVLRGHERPPPGIPDTKPGALHTRMKYILIKSDDSWRIVSAQNTAISDHIE